MHPCGTARTGSLCPLIVYLVNGSVPMNYSLFFSPTNIYSQVIKKFSDSGIRSCETRKKYLENRLMRSKSPDGNKKTSLYMDTVFSSTVIIFQQTKFLKKN